MAGPLEGVNVVELGVWVAAPAAGGILADWGADVVKIEPPAGDPARMFGRMLGMEPGVNPPFEMDNRSKRSVVLDLGTDDGRQTAVELISGADVFVSNVRPAALQRLGLDFETVAARSPHLVYGLLTGYGMTGPEANRPAYDVAAFWARAGLADLLTRPGGTPPFQRGGMGDHSAGMTLAAAVCAALVARDRTGVGQLVTTSLYRQGSYTVSFDLNTLLMSGHSIAIGQRETMGNPCILDRIFATRPLAEWAEIFDAEPDFFWSPINTLEDVLGDDQFHAGGGVVYVPDGEGTVPMVASPADFHGTPAEPRSVAPQLGEHTEEVLAELNARRAP
jgi:crotonobetainyl-CoA:carnitine CoA-transferase CaiB-like acyl-CoA transferase